MQLNMKPHNKTHNEKTHNENLFKVLANSCCIMLPTKLPTSKPNLITHYLKIHYLLIIA